MNIRDYEHTAPYIFWESLKVRTYQITNIQHHTYLGRAWNYEHTRLRTYSTIHILGELQSTNLPDYKYTALFILSQSFKVRTAPYIFGESLKIRYYKIKITYHLPLPFSFGSIIHLLKRKVTTDTMNYQITILLLTQIFMAGKNLKLRTYILTSIRSYPIQPYNKPYLLTKIPKRSWIG